MKKKEIPESSRIDMKLKFVAMATKKDKDENRTWEEYPFWDVEHRCIVATDGYRCHCWCVPEETELTLPSVSSFVGINKGTVEPRLYVVDCDLPKKIFLNAVTKLLEQPFQPQQYIFGGNRNTDIPDLLYFVNTSIDLRYLTAIWSPTINWDIATIVETVDRKRHVKIKFTGKNDFSDLIAIVASRKISRETFIETGVETQ